MKKLLALWLIISLFCGNGTLHAQSAKEQSDRVAQLYAQGRYVEGTKLALEVVARLEKTLGPDHRDVAISLVNLALLYQAQERYAEAEPLLKRSLPILEKALGGQHFGVANVLLTLGTIYQRQGRYAEAEPLLKRTVPILEKTLGRNHPSVAAVINNLASLQQDQGRYAEAESLYKRSLETNEKVLGAHDPAVAQSLSDLATLYYEQGRYSEAEPLFNRSLTIYEKALGAHHPTVAMVLNNLATLYNDQGRYVEAEALYKRSLAALEKTFGANHPDVATALSNLATLYQAQGRYGEAEPVLKRSVAITEKALGAGHSEVAAKLNNLGDAYREAGRYAEAETLFKRSLVIFERALGGDHPSVAASLNNLASLYKLQGRYAEAKLLLERSVAITEKALGNDHPSVATALLNLASIYQDQGLHAQAEPLYKRSLAITERVFGTGHPDVGTGLNSLATLYLAQGRYAEAEKLLKRSLAVLEKALGSDHADLAASLSHLAWLYDRQGRYSEAEALLKRSLVLREKALGPDHPDVALSLSNLASLYEKRGRIDIAAANSRRAVAIVAKRTADTDGERTRGTNSNQRKRQEYILQNVALVHALQEAGAEAETLRVAQLAQASSAARALAGMAARFASGKDALAAVVRERQDLAARWQSIDAALVKAASQPPDKRNAAAEAALRANLTTAGQRLDALDARIARDFPRYAELSQPPPLELGAAQALLAPDEALLVYLVGDDESWLWVLRRDRAAMHRIELGSKALETEVKALRERLDPALNPRGLKPFDAARAHALYEKILAPAAPLLDGARHVLVVPDGALESLPMGVLVTAPPAAEPKSAVDHRAVAWFAREHALTVLPSVGSLRALRQFASRTQAASPFVGIGNPVLEGPPSGTGVPKLTSLFRGPLADVAEVRRLPRLTETANELGAIAKVMGANERDLYLAERASEPHLRQAGLERYRVIAFATHGLMSGQLKDLAEPALVLTPPREASPENDGLLTASEVATLKLNADWVVLSACNTAATDGTPDAGGLSGLAKAFFYAGARSLLVSHWAVPSQATVKLITSMFEALAKDPAIGRAEALRRAEMAMLDPSSPPDLAHPLFWAPFVLAGEGGKGR